MNLMCDSVCVRILSFRRSVLVVATFPGSIASQPFESPFCTVLYRSTNIYYYM